MKKQKFIENMRFKSLIWGGRGTCVPLWPPRCMEGGQKDRRGSEGGRMSPFPPFTTLREYPYS
jgi:hypothetical protein